MAAQGATERFHGGGIGSEQIPVVMHVRAYISFDAGAQYRGGTAPLSSSTGMAMDGDGRDTFAIESQVC
jgi:hypothetical protein